MRAALLVLLLVLPPVAASDPPACNFAVHESRVVPNTNYWIGVERSVCQAGPGAYYHAERVLVTEGHPYAPGSVLLAGFVYYSYRAENEDGSRTIQDMAALQSGARNASVAYRSDQDAIGFTTCSVTARYSEPPTAATVGSGRLNACPPHEWTYV